MAAATTPFPALRMSTEDFDAYRRRLPQGFPRSRAPGERAPQSVKVTGYGQEAKDAILAANDGNGDTIEVPWGPVDSVFWIMQRVEDKLRIPLEYWYLAGKGHVLGSGMLVGGHELFTTGNVIELALVPSSEVDQYEEENPLPEPEAYVWRHLQPGTTDSTDPLEKAKAAYHLINPVASTSWETYLAQRQKAEDQLKEMTDSYSFDEYETLADQVKNSVESVVEDLDLPEEQQFAIADGVLPQDLYFVDEGDGDPREATVFTRIYSPTKPAAVDVYFQYWHRTRWESVEFTCALFVRVHDPVADASAPAAGSPMNRNGGAARGWTRVFRMAFDSYPPGRRWYAKRIMDWGLRASHVNKVHTALFGRAGQPPAAAVEKVDTVRLVLAAAGIPFQVARAEDESDALDPDRIGSFNWECFHDRWIGTNIREACGAPLDMDADWEISEDENPYEDDEDSENDSDGYHDDYW